MTFSISNYFVLQLQVVISCFIIWHLLNFDGINTWDNTNGMTVKLCYKPVEITSLLYCCFSSFCSIIQGLFSGYFVSSPSAEAKALMRYYNLLYSFYSFGGGIVKILKIYFLNIQEKTYLGHYVSDLQKC